MNYRTNNLKQVVFGIMFLTCPNKKMDTLTPLIKGNNLASLEEYNKQFPTRERILGVIAEEKQYQLLSVFSFLIQPCDYVDYRKILSTMYVREGTKQRRNSYS